LLEFSLFLVRIKTQFFCKDTSMIVDRFSYEQQE